MQKRVWGQILCGKAVTSVDTSESQVRIWLGREMHEFDRVVFAIPPNLLRQIEWVPGVGEAHEDAWEAFAMSRTQKVALHFKRKFWLDHDWNGGLLTDRYGQQFWDGSRGAGATLLTYMNGAEAAEPANPERLVATLAEVAPEAAAEFVRAETHDWWNEEFSGGGFAFYPPGFYWITPRRCKLRSVGFILPEITRRLGWGLLRGLWKAQNGCAVKFKNFQTWEGSGVPDPSEGGFDCRGKWLIPAFTDSHCHVLPMGLDMQALSLVELADREAVLAAIVARDRELEPGAWLRAVQYDQNRFPGADHLTRSELDAINPKRPILLRHSNGHASIANSAALGAANVNRDTPDPKGGTYCRDADGELNGLLLERAHERVTATIPAPTDAEMVAAITDAARAMQRFGIVRAADMMTGRWNLRQEVAAYDAVAAETGFAFALYVQWADVFGPRGIGADALREIELKSGNVHIAGIKIFADGAIGSATAAVYEPYITTGETGALIYAPNRLTNMVVTATEAGFATCIHSIGDRSTDLVLDAFEASGDPNRHRIEHAMILSDAQIERLARLNPLVSMQPEFLTRFRTGYRNQLGLERASKLVRIKSVVDAGLRVVLNSDRPIVLGDPWVGMRCATSRPEGYDPAENIDFDQAFAMYTNLAAEACGWTGDAVAYLLYSEDPRIGHAIDPEIFGVNQTRA